MMSTHPPPPPLEEPDEQSPELYRVAMSTLRYGFLISAALFAAGLVGLLLVGEEMSDRVMPVDEIPRAIADREPMALLDLAFLTLMLTPVAVVLRLAITFTRLGERRFGMLSFLVLAILVASAALALIR